MFCEIRAEGVRTVDMTQQMWDCMRGEHVQYFSVQIKDIYAIDTSTGNQLQIAMCRYCRSLFVVKED